MANRLDFARQPQGFLEVGAKADLPMVGEQAGGAAFHRLEHRGGKAGRSKLGIVRDPEARAACHANHVVEGGHILAQAGKGRGMGGMDMHDGARLGPRLVDIEVHPPFRRGQEIAAIAAFEVHLYDVVRFHPVIGNAGRGDEKALLGAHADIARRALVDSQFIHGEAGGNDLLAQ